MASNKVWLEVVDQVVVVRKQFVGPTTDRTGQLLPAAQRYERHGQWLQAARNLGAVDLLGIDTNSLTLTTRFAGGRTLGDPSLPEDQLAHYLLRTCQTLRQLHDAGLTHGSITAAHIIVSSDQVRLCSGSNTGDHRSNDAIGFSKLVGELAQSRLAYANHENPRVRPKADGLFGRRARRRQQRWVQAGELLRENHGEHMPTLAELDWLLPVSPLLARR